LTGQRRSKIKKGGKKMKLEELEERVAEIKKALQPWKGMTWKEASEHGWGEEQRKLQLELWNLGQKIIERRNKQ